jgi:hypothetical protein
VTLEGSRGSNAAAAAPGLGPMGLPDDILGAVHFVASFEHLQGPLLDVLGTLNPKP